MGLELPRGPQFRRLREQTSNPDDPPRKKAATAAALDATTVKSSTPSPRGQTDVVTSHQPGRRLRAQRSNLDDAPTKKKRLPATPQQFSAAGHDGVAKTATGPRQAADASADQERKTEDGPTVTKHRSDMALYEGSTAQEGSEDEKQYDAKLAALLASED